MPLYTFYPCNPDGGSESFEVYELRDDGDARTRAMVLLGEHQRCAYVAAWQGDRKVVTCRRGQPRSFIETD